MFSLICIWINGSVNNREAGDLRRNRGHYDVIVMYIVVVADAIHFWSELKVPEGCLIFDAHSIPTFENMFEVPTFN